MKAFEEGLQRNFLPSKMAERRKNLIQLEVYSICGTVEQNGGAHFFSCFLSTHIEWHSLNFKSFKGKALLNGYNIILYSASINLSPDFEQLLFNIFKKYVALKDISGD